MILAASFDTGDINMWDNRALMYGDGVFETMRCIKQQVPLWSWHQQRLQNSLSYLQIEPPEFKVIEQVIKEQTSENQVVLRLTVFRQQQKRGYQAHSQQSHWLITQYPYQEQGQPQILGLAKQRLSPQPLLKGLKHLNRLPQVLIANELAGQDVDDLLVLNQQDDVIETTSQNLLVVVDNQIYTPDLQHCGVEGVALTWLKQQLSVKTKKLKLVDIQKADAMMTSNAVHGFRVVSDIKSQATFKNNQPICARISSLWQQLINSA